MKGDTFLLVLRLGFSLSLIFGLMWIAAKVVRKQSGRRGRRVDHLEVIERKPLTKNSSIAIVRVGGETLTVGVTDSHVSLLGQVDVGLELDDVTVLDGPHDAVDLRAPATTTAATTAAAPALTPAAAAAATAATATSDGRGRRDTVVPVDGSGRRGLLDVLRDRTVRHIPG